MQHVVVVNAAVSLRHTFNSSSGYNNAGILAAASLALAALVWPSLLCLPYLLLLGGAVLAWSASASSPAGSRSMRVLQVYTGEHADYAGSGIFTRVFYACKSRIALLCPALPALPCPVLPLAVDM